MKKLITILLCIACVLSLAVTAYAESTEDTRQTIVSLELDPTMESYTLTIPATISIDPATKSATLKATLADVNLVWHKYLGVTAVAANHDTEKGGSYLVHTEDATKKIHYTLKTDDGEVYTETSTGMSIASYSAMGNTEPTLNNGWIELTVDGEYPDAGTYTDTITFTVKLS